MPDNAPPPSPVAAPSWLTQVIAVPQNDARQAAKMLHPYLDVAAAKEQAAWDEKLLSIFREAGDGPLALDRLDFDIYARANFNRVLDGRPLVHHVIERRNVIDLLRMISCKTEQGPVVSPTDTDAQGRNPTDYAAALGWDEGVQYLKNYGHQPSTPPRYTSNHQLRMNQILIRAVEASDATIVDTALLHGAQPNLKARGHLTLLQLAILNLNKEVVQRLIGAGADLHELHVRGETPLQLLWWCHAPKRLGPAWYEMVDVLKACGADTENFKLPHEMTDAELAAPLPGAGPGTTAMEYCLQAGDYAAYRRGLAACGITRAATLSTYSTVLQETPLEHLCRADKLDEVFRAEVWHGDVRGLRQAWGAIAAEAAKPSRFRDDKPTTFTAADFAVVLAQVEQSILTRRAPQHLKLKLGRR